MDGVDAGTGRTSQPWEGERVRSRLWQLILRELPFPFREIGTEIVRVISWIDKTAARIWLGFAKFPAWYVVAAAGTMAFLLTALLFMSLFSGRDRTLGELAHRSNIVPVTREKLEKAGDWAAQDKWRLAHMFVPHRPSRRHAVGRLDRPLVNDPVYVSSGADRRHGPDENLVMPDTEVQLDLGSPLVAEQPKRLVAGQFVRDAGTDSRHSRPASSYRTRDSRLLVQAEWDLGPDCDPPEVVHHPARRDIPVPEPDPAWDELPPKTQDDRHPDLSFTMSMLREFLPEVGEFPPRSRLASVSVHSEFPESLDSFNRSHLLSDNSHWKRTSIDREVPQRRTESYVDRVGVDEDLPPLDDPDHELRLNSVPSFAEVALRLELLAPKSTVAGQTSHSSLVVSNDGLRDIPLITVREPLVGLDTVTDAIPPARVDPFDNSLERRIQRLEPGRKERLELIWRPDEEGRRIHTARVTIQAAVGATTEIVPAVAEQPMPSVAPEPMSFQEPQEPVEPRPIPEPNPRVSLDVQNQPRATVDDIVEIAILVRNTGDVPLHDVRVVAELPEHLKHRRGTEVELTIDTLPVRGSERAVLRVVAQSAGKAICKLHVAANEQAEAKSRAVIDVQAKPVKQEPKVAKRAPAPKQAVPPPNCCCPLQPVAYFEPCGR